MVEMSSSASITTQVQPTGPPYFADDGLDRKEFLRSLRQPVGGPCAASQLKPARENAEEEGDPKDDWVDEDSRTNATPAATTSELKAAKPTVLSSSGKKEYASVRVAGGRAPMAKKVTWELDSDDEIIVGMKQRNATDYEVAERLVSEGRTWYNHKTISSRWIRLRKALAKREDELLDEDLTDWHEGEDELLFDAYDMADEQVLQELEKVREKRWLYVAQHLRQLKPSSRYSQFACKDRYEALEAGTARIPPELDDDPAARAREREEKRAAKAQAEAEKAREKAEAEEKARIEAEQAAIQAEESRKAKAEAKARLEEEKAEAAYAAAASKVAKEQARLEAARAKEEAAAEAKMENEAKEAAAEKEKELVLAIKKAEREEKVLQAKAAMEEKAQKALRAKAEKYEIALRKKAEKEETARLAKAEREEKALREKAEKVEREAQAKAARNAKAKAALQTALEKVAQAKLNLAVKTSNPAGAKARVKAQKKPDTKVSSARQASQGAKRKAQGDAADKDQPAKKKQKPKIAPASARGDAGELPAPGQSQKPAPTLIPNSTSAGTVDRPGLAGKGVQRAVAGESKMSKVGLEAPKAAPKPAPVLASVAAVQSKTLVPSIPSAITNTATPSDPRESLSIPELSAALKARGLKQSGKETELLKHIADHDTQLSAKELKEKLCVQDRKTKGTKQELI